MNSHTWLFLAEFKKIGCINFDATETHKTKYI